VAETHSRLCSIQKAKPYRSFARGSRRVRLCTPTKPPLGTTLHERFEVKRIDHQEAYSLNGARTNMAEEHVSWLRRTEIGIQHHIAGAYLLLYAQESSWRE
jgi:hypothetical protein